MGILTIKKVKVCFLTEEGRWEAPFPWKTYLLLQTLHIIVVIIIIMLSSFRTLNYSETNSSQHYRFSRSPVTTIILLVTSPPNACQPPNIYRCSIPPILSSTIYILVPLNFAHIWWSPPSISLNSISFSFSFSPFLVLKFFATGSNEEWGRRRGVSGAECSSSAEAQLHPPLRTEKRWRGDEQGEQRLRGE